ncbi:MAG: amidohydrolase family protein [Candidatus Thorarchaeota archaeon]
MNKLIIKNGLIYDPLTNIEGEKKDILVESGKIVDKFSNESDIKEIDATGKAVIPAATDIHTHVASQQINWVRLLGYYNKVFQEVWQGLTLEGIARAYISMGYTFILEANVFPSLAKQTIFNFQQIPVLDKGMLLNVSNFWPLEVEFQRGKIDDMAIFISDLLSKTKGFGLKVYNPFECENWNFKSLREDLATQGRLYNFSALDVYENIVKCVEKLGLPHSAHAHIEAYENNEGKENLFKVLDRINSLGLANNLSNRTDFKRSQILHLAHLNSYCMDGDNSKLINYLNESSHFTSDLSFLGFNKINPIITSDRRLIQSKITMNIISNPYKLITSAVEFEGDSFVSLRTMDKANYHACILWANALELALNIKSQNQLSLSLNFPNYANISDIPQIATWLISKEARESLMKGMNDKFLKNTNLFSLEKELTFFEFISISRANPAKALGLGRIKGTLGLEADADINIIDIDPQNLDLSKEYEKFQLAMNRIDYVIKAGKIVKKQNNIDLNSEGLIFWSEGHSKEEEKDFILSKKQEFYNKYSSIFYDSIQDSIDSKLLRKID